MQAVGIDHVVLRVSDLERAVAFYRDVLGLAIDRRRENLGMVHMRAGPSLVDLVEVGGPLGRQGGAAPGPTHHFVACALLSGVLRLCFCYNSSRQKHTK